MGSGISDGICGIVIPVVSDKELVEEEMETVV